MSKFVAVVGAALAGLLPVAASAAPSIQFLGAVLPTDLSQDGSVVVGNLPGSFETFRWTQSTGVVPLGRPTVPTLGTGAGSPDVSWDGTKVSATILSDSGTQAVAGRWTLGSGWQELGTLPEPLVYLRDVDASILQDIRYAGPDNFTGRPVPGYGAHECVILREAAEALSRVQRGLLARNLSLKVYDCYRPRQAVRTFVAFVKDGADADSMFPALSNCGPPDFDPT